MPKALSVWQPYATLLLAKPAGAKKPVKGFETRGWATDYRGVIAIHAAKRPVKDVLAEIRDARVLRVMGEALARILYPESPPSWQEMIVLLSENPRLLPTGAVIGDARLRGCRIITPELIAKQAPAELALGDWTPGRYAWELADKRRCIPVAARGRQGLWDW